MRIRSSILAIGFLSLVLAPVARSEGLTLGGDLYQRQLLQTSEQKEKLEVDPRPDGKMIERVVVVPYDVFIAQDPWPKFFNLFHVTTRSEVVERELLFQTGDRWSPETIEESARNLRTNLFLSIARIVPCHGSTSDRVVALVVTKDLWSLRLNESFTLVGSSLQNLDLQLTESNLLGRMKQVIADFEMDLASYYLGEEYDDPRLLGGELTFSEKAGGILNRSSGGTEGAVAAVSVQKPLRTVATEWSWNLSTDFREDVYRLFTTGAIYTYISPITGEGIPFEYDRQLLNMNASLIRSYGGEHKQDFSVGWAGYVHQFEMPTGETVSAPALADFENSFLPYSQNAGTVFVSYRNYQTKFVQTMDLDSFAVTEDYRLGADWTIQSSFASSVFGFNSTYWEPLTTLNALFPFGDDYLSLAAEFRVRYEPGFIADSDWINRLGYIQIKNFSPKFGFFRAVASLRYIRRGDDVLKSLDELGGDNVLRGYPVGYFVGSQSVVGNLELRTLPAIMYTVHVGAAAFFDCGDAFDVPDQFQLHESVGLGFRVLFPQFNRAVIRLDFGFPLEQLAAGYNASYFVAQFGQAF